MKREDWKKTTSEFVDLVVCTDPRTVTPDYSKELSEKMEWFKDIKFGFFVHYGLYSEAGTMESWPMCKQKCWTWARTCDPRFEKEFNGDYDKYISWYLGGSKTINPSKFNATEWMDIVEGAGCKYFAFTSKHHDGYCLFDSKYSDFKITNDDSGRKVDMLKELFDEADKRNLGKWLYFSQADWTHKNWTGPYYYDKDDKNLDHSQKVDVDPKQWELFTQYYENQLTELLTNYGRIDCLWLDSNWLRPDNGYDLHMDRIAPKAREMHKGLMIVDRADHRNEDYWTPEQTLITDPVTNMPWETVITLGNHWGWMANDEYKDEHWVIDALLNNISNGGNLNLGIGPCADGSFPEYVLKVLKNVGKFTSKNGEGIYSTRTVAPYHNEDAYFTSSKDKKTVYAFIKSEINSFDIPEEFKGVKSITDVTGSELTFNDMKVNLEQLIENDFEYKLIKLHL